DDRSKERVRDPHDARGHPQTDRRRALEGSRREAEDTAGPGIARALLAGMRRARHGRDLGTRAVAVVEQVAGREGREGVLVAPATLRWPVGRMGAAHVRALVPVEAEPAQVVELALLHSGYDARAVDVLDAQDERASGGARRQPSEKRRRRRAEMEVA